MTGATLINCRCRNILRKKRESVFCTKVSICSDNSNLLAVLSVSCLHTVMLLKCLIKSKIQKKLTTD